jgi:RimJ/RimL family protein N-acetyltransferase
MTEGDWSLLEKWNSDAEVLYYSEGDDIAAWTPEQVREIYRSVCRHAFCFVIEFDGLPVGEGWLQEMNLPRVLETYPAQDCRRIDLMIGEKRQWGRGIGTEAIRLLTRFGFLEQGADVIFIPGVAGYNERSLKAFQRAGYRVVSMTQGEPCGKARFLYDLVMTKDDYLRVAGQDNCPP